jgi:hypothetical protein
VLDVEQDRSEVGGDVIFVGTVEVFVWGMAFEGMSLAYPSTHMTPGFR